MGVQDNNYEVYWLRQRVFFENSFLKLNQTLAEIF